MIGHFAGIENINSFRNAFSKIISKLQEAALDNGKHGILHHEPNDREEAF